MYVYMHAFISCLSSSPEPGGHGDVGFRLDIQITVIEEEEVDNIILYINLVTAILNRHERRI